MRVFKPPVIRNSINWIGISINNDRAEYSLSQDLMHILSHTENGWNDLRGKRIFITGGTGFFGKWLLHSFIHANDTLNLKAHAYVLTRFPQQFRHIMPLLTQHPAIHLHEGDVTNFEFPTGEFSHLIHAGTSASAALNQENPCTMFDTIVLGMKRMLEFSSQCKATKLLFTSSGAVYGSQPPGLTHLPEEGFWSESVSENAYARGKRLAEHMVLNAASRQLSVKIARGFAFVGPYLPLTLHYAIGNFLYDAKNSKTIKVKGDGLSVRSYLYAADLMIWLWTILFKGQSCRPYNVGSDKAISTRELAACIAQKCNPKKPVEIQCAPIVGSMSHYVPSIERAKTELNLDVWVDLDKAIERCMSEWCIC